MKSEKKISDAEFEVQYLEYIPNKNPSDRVVLIVPPTGGTNFIDRSYAKALCRAGIHAVVLDHWSDDDEFNYELEIHTRFYNRAQRAIDLLVEEFSRAEDRTKPSIGVLGTSVGALHGSIAFGRRAEISSAYLIVGGGDIADIIVNSDQGVMEDAKRERFKRYGFKSDAEYKSALEKILPFEPLRLKFNRPSKKLAMVISKKDTTVPGTNQLQLREAWRPDVVSYSRWGHMGAIVSTWLFGTSEVVEFFKDSRVPKAFP